MDLILIDTLVWGLIVTVLFCCAAEDLVHYPLGSGGGLIRPNKRGFQEVRSEYPLKWNRLYRYEQVFLFCIILQLSLFDSRPFCRYTVFL